MIAIAREIDAGTLTDDDWRAMKKPARNWQTIRSGERARYAAKLEAAAKKRRSR